MKIICEFVANKEVQRVLKALAIDFAQGYYYAKPHEI